MTGGKASFLSCLCLVLLPCAIEAILKDACPKEARIIVSSEEQKDKPILVSMRNLTLEFDGFPQDLKWFANGSIYGCICDVFSCLRLCCPRGAVRENGTCILTNGDFVDEWPDIYFRNLTLKPSDDFFPIVGYPCGEEGAYELDLPEPSDPKAKFHLFDDGLSIQIGDSVLDKYCLQSQGTSYVPRVCFGPDEDSYVVPDPVLVVGFLISIPCLLVTFIVYVLLPELNTIHGLMLRCYLASLVVSSIFVVIQRLVSVEEYIWLCRFIALGIHFSFSASFMWLNVMCIDIWRTFRNITLIVHSDRKRKKFLLYSIYAWGMTSIFTTVCIFMELLPGLSQDLILPEILSSSNCWFATWEAESAYFYGPITAILICNTFMFIATTIRIMWHQRNVAPQLNNDQSKLHHDSTEWFILYFKLFIIMGINWVTEVTAWWWKEDYVQYLWYITDTLNALQGFTIFIILVCKRKILLSLKKHFEKIRRPPTDKGLPLMSSLMNASRRTQNNTSNCQTTESHDISTSDSILSSNSHGSSPSKNIVEARLYQ